LIQVDINVAKKFDHLACLGRNAAPRVPGVYELEELEEPQTGLRQA
jgi:hypothetical protein